MPKAPGPTIRSLHQNFSVHWKQTRETYKAYKTNLRRITCTTVQCCNQNSHLCRAPHNHCRKSSEWMQRSAAGLPQQHKLLKKQLETPCFCPRKNFCWYSQIFLAIKWEKGLGSSLWGREALCYETHDISRAMRGALDYHNSNPVSAKIID